MGFFDSLGRVSSDIRVISSVVVGIILIIVGVGLQYVKPSQPGYQPPPGTKPVTPKDASQMHMIGGLLILFGIVAPILSVVWAHYVHKSKTLATVAGALDTASIADDIIKGL